MSTESPLVIIKKVYDRNLKLRREDRLAVDAFISTLIAAYHPKLVEGVWLHLCAPGSSGKTEMVVTMDGFPDGVTMLSSFTENSLCSGANDEQGRDPSLIPQLENKVLIIKDLSALKGGAKQLLHKIFGDMRDVYDGIFDKASGTLYGGRHYRIRFGVVTCVTEVVDEFNEEFTQLGPRFLIMRMVRDPVDFEERVQIAKSIIQLAPSKSTWKAEMGALVRQQVAGLREQVISNPIVPIIPEKLRDNLAVLASLLTLLRSTAIEGSAGEPELPPRATQQLMNMGHAHCIADGRMEWTGYEISLIRRIVVDTLPKKARKLLQYMFKRPTRLVCSSIEMISNHCKLGMSTVERLLSQYHHVGVVEPSELKQGTLYYRLSEKVYDAMRHSGLFLNSPHDEEIENEEDVKE